MHSRVLDVLARSFAAAGGILFFVAIATFHFMRAKANLRLAPEHRISWLLAGATPKLVISDYRRLYPEGWGYRALRIIVISWATLLAVFLVLEILG